MSSSILFHVVIFCFLIISIWESRRRVTFNTTPQQIRIPNVLVLIIVISLGVLATLGFTILGPRLFVLWYMKAAFSALLVGHALWLGINQKLHIKLFWIGIAILMVGARLLYPTILTHNLFIFFSLLWFGPFFTQMKLLTKKRFVIISLIWFAYDIIYVWLTPLADVVIGTTEAIGFPLSVAIGDQFMGSADLLWANCFLSLVTSVRKQWIGIAALMLSNIGLSIFAAHTPDLTIFPLLVLWVPIGIMVLRAR